MSSELKGAVFDALNALQHPSNCSAARKLVCNFNKGCGFGCELHHVVHCLAHAIALNRTMVLKVRTQLGRQHCAVLFVSLLGMHR